MLSEGFELTIPAFKRLQTYGLHCAITGIVLAKVTFLVIVTKTVTRDVKFELGHTV